MIHLGRFWLGRARRLLPALFLMLLVVIAWVTIFGPAQPDQFRKAVVSAIFYVNNWQQIAANVSYFARFAPEQPLNHLWSLSVEEQFYIFWPFILLIGLKFIRDRQGNGLRPKLALATLGLAIASSILMAVLYHPSLDPSRVYYGTDTRAAGLLFGAALAMVWPSRRLNKRITPQARKTLDGMGVRRPPDHRDHDLADRRVLPVPLPRRLRRPLAGDGDGADAARPPGLPARQRGRLQTAALDRRPLLRHLPLADAGDRPHLARRAPHGQSLLRDALQVAAIFVIASLSWKFVEEPIRHGAIGRLLARRRRVGWSWATFSPEGRIVLVAVGVLFIVAIAGMAGLNAAQAEGEQIRVKEATAAGTKGPVPLTAAQAADSQKTSCKAVVHIGDSTSEGLDSAEYLPDPKERIENRYAEVGVKETHMEVQGARSIEERFEDQPNAQEVAEAWKAEGYKGCWVLALGTNEAADVAAGSSVGLRRTDRKNDEHHRRRTGPLGQRQDAARGDRILCRERHEEMGRRTRKSLPALSQHAHLQLGRRRQRRLVHQ